MKYLYILLALSGASGLSADWNDGSCDAECRQRYYQDSQRAQGYNNQGNNNNQQWQGNQQWQNGQQRNQQQNYGGYVQSNNPQDLQNNRYVEQLPNDQRMMRNDQRPDFRNDQRQPMNRNDQSIQYGGYDQNNNNNNAMKATDDRQVSDKVKGVVAGGWFSSGNKSVLFDVNNGTVTLKGTVASDEEKNKIEQEIRKIDGVRNVNNQIQIVAVNDKKGDYSQDRFNSDQDRQLNTKIRSKLNGWFSTSYDAVVLQTNNGIVVLWGTVKNVDDQTKLTAEVKNIDGVKSVTNNTKIQTE